MSGRNKDSSETKVLFGLHNDFYIHRDDVYIWVRRGIHTIHPNSNRLLWTKTKIHIIPSSQELHLPHFIVNTQKFHVEWNRILQYINEQLPHLTHYFNVETARYKNTLDQPYSPNLRSAIPPSCIQPITQKIEVITDNPPHTKQNTKLDDILILLISNP